MSLILKKECYHCHGAGEIPVYSIDGNNNLTTCFICNGTGEIELGEVNVSDFMDKLNDILDKCNDIFERISED